MLVKCVFVPLTAISLAHTTEAAAKNKQDTNVFFSAQGIPVIAQACSFTSFCLISYGRKEDKKY